MMTTRSEGYQGIGRLGVVLAAALVAAGCGGDESAIDERLQANTVGAFLNQEVRIGNAKTGKCLGPETTISAAQHINQYTCGNAGTFFILPLAGNNTGFLIKPTPSSPYCVDIEQGTSYGGERVQYYPCHGGSNQAFFLSNREIKPRHSGQCFDVPYGYTTEGLLVQQYPCNNGENQKWQIQHAITNQIFPF